MDCVPSENKHKAICKPLVFFFLFFSPFVSADWDSDTGNLNDRNCLRTFTGTLDLDPSRLCAAKYLEEVQLCIYLLYLLFFSAALM